MGQQRAQAVSLLIATLHFYLEPNQMTQKKKKKAEAG